MKRFGNRCAREDVRMNAHLRAAAAGWRWGRAALPVRRTPQSGWTRDVDVLTRVGGGLTPGFRGRFLQLSPQCLLTLATPESEGLA